MISAAGLHDKCTDQIVETAFHGNVKLLYSKPNSVLFWPEEAGTRRGRRRKASRTCIGCNGSNIIRLSRMFSWRYRSVPNAKLPSASWPIQFRKNKNKLIECSVNIF